MDPVPVPRPAQTAWQDFDAEQCQLFETLVGLVRQEPDWPARKPLLLQIIQRLRDGFLRVARETGSRLPYMALLPVHLGAILERLDEAELGSLEQAAFYLLSIHPEHQAAAEAWLQAAPRRDKEFLRFLGANPFLGALLREQERYRNPELG